MKIGSFFKDLLSSWSADKISSLSAALAYYTLFSLAPIILISIDLSSLFLGATEARHEIFNQIKDIISPETSLQIQLMVEKFSRPKTGFITQIIGWSLIIIGSTAVFSEMQSGLNHIWGVAKPKLGLLEIIKQRLISFIMVLCVAVLLLLSFILTVSFTAMSGYLNQLLNVGVIELLILHCISFFIVFLLFSMIFKILPDVKIPWKDIWLGALITTILFQVGKYILGIYLSRVPIASLFGAAGSLIILLIWVYYSAQIFFIGAEITKVIVFEKKEIIKPKREGLTIEAIKYQPSLAKLKKR